MMPARGSRNRAVNRTANTFVPPRCNARGSNSIMPGARGLPQGGAIRFQRAPERTRGSMAEDFRRYEAMRDAGADPQAVYQAAQRDGLDGIALIRLLRAVFSLTLREAVDVRNAVEQAAAKRLAVSLGQHRGESVAPSARLLEHLHASDFQSMDQFPLRWRWTDPKWNELPPERLSRILPLTASKAKEFHERGMAFFHALNLRHDLFSQISKHDDTAS